MDFVAIDFETANEKRWSPCEVSLVKVRNGIVTDTLTQFIKPHESVSFNPWNVGIHGISPTHVANAPEFDQIFLELQDFSADLPFVAHSAGFDIGVLRQTAQLYEIKLPKITYYCTRIMAQRVKQLDLASYRLANVCDFLGIDFTESHRAQADALAAAEVLLALGRIESAESLEDLASRLLIGAGEISDSGSRSIRSARASYFPTSLSKSAAAAFIDALPVEDLRIDEDFKDKEVIFTGTLASMDRKTAQEKVLRAGGFTGGNVSKKTSVVVVGAPYDSQLKPGGDLSGKLKKVLDLRKAGAEIEIITEQEFLELFEN